MPITSTLFSSAAFEAVVAQNNVDQVLANIVNVTAHRSKQYAALAAVIGLFNVRFEMGNGSLHDLGRLQDEWQLHFTFAEKLTDNLHSLEQVLIDDVEGRFRNR